MYSRKLKRVNMSQKIKILLSSYFHKHVILLYIFENVLIVLIEHILYDLHHLNLFPIKIMLK